MAHNKNLVLALSSCYVPYYIQRPSGQGAIPDRRCGMHNGLCMPSPRAYDHNPFDHLADFGEKPKPTV